MSTPTEKKEEPVTLETTGQAEVKTYAILQETSGEESESWLYFIKYQGNEEALTHLGKQLAQVDWYILDDLSTFDLETDYLVCERTAKEMTKVDLNHYSFHRKFDGKLKKIDLGFKDHHSNEKKMTKAFNVLGYGKIEDFIDGEDVDPEDLASHSQCSESETSSDTESETESESESESEEEEDEKPNPEKKKGKMPDVVSKKPPKIEIPRFAKAKAKRRDK
jgi:hypothetical protein